VVTERSLSQRWRGIKDPGTGLHKVHWRTFLMSWT